MAGDGVAELALHFTRSTLYINRHALLMINGWPQIIQRGKTATAIPKLRRIFGDWLINEKTLIIFLDFGVMVAVETATAMPRWMLFTSCLCIELAGLRGSTTNEWLVNGGVWFVYRSERQCSEFVCASRPTNGRKITFYLYNRIDPLNRTEYIVFLFIVNTNISSFEVALVIRKKYWD